MPLLKINSLSKNYGEFSLQDISLEMEEKETLALLGESGSGKTSLLRLIAGLERPDKGDILLDGEILADQKAFIPPQKRPISLAFQDHALFPHLSVRKNVSFGLYRWPKLIRENRSNKLLQLVGLADRADHSPSALSGGEQQRVALARALAPEPRLLLLDEPFSKLDAARRERLREDVGEVLRATATPAILVTHDVLDVYALARRVAVLDRGRLVQIGEPREVYRHPRNAYIARLFGPANIYSTQVLAPFFPVLKSLQTTLCIRPEQVAVGEEGLEVKLNKRFFRGGQELWELESELGKWMVWGDEKKQFPQNPKIQLLDWHSMNET